MSLRPEEVRVHVWRRATALQALLNRLDDLRDQIIAELDAIDGDADLEPQCEDEGAEHDGREPDTDNEPGDPIMGAG
jgi:hypothetical protein